MAKIIFYTNPNCPFAQRAAIALEELGLQYEEVIIQLHTPREPWYLKINPRGLVPALSYDGHLIVESLVITQFLVDLKASHLAPNTGTFDAALTRARASFFVDTLKEKIQPSLYSIVHESDTEVRATKSNELVDLLEKHIVPLLEGAAPFFGGNKQLGLAEVNTAPFILRIYAYASPEADILSPTVVERLRANKVWQNWVDAVFAQKSVSATWDEELNIKGLQQRLAALRAPK